MQAVNSIVFEFVRSFSQTEQ